MCRRPVGSWGSRAIPCSGICGSVARIERSATRRSGAPGVVARGAPHRFRSRSCDEPAAGWSLDVSAWVKLLREPRANPLMASRHELKRYHSNLSDELDTAAVYETLARVDKDEAHRAVFLQLATAEREHAQPSLHKPPPDTGPGRPAPRQ